MGCAGSKPAADTGDRRGAWKPAAGARPQHAPARQAVRPSQLANPTIDPATGLPFQSGKKKKKNKATAAPDPDMGKQCAWCQQIGTLFSKEDFLYCGTACMRQHAEVTQRVLICHCRRRSFAFPTLDPTCAPRFGWPAQLTYRCRITDRRV
jgi:hypothetical protein